MNRLARLILIFAIAFAILIVSPAFLDQQFGPYPLLKIGDVTDVLTPLILIPIYWLLFQFERDKLPSAKETMVFLIAAAFWVEGQGIHLSANSIGHLAEVIPTSEIAQLTHFFDEILSHYLWHIGLVSLMILLLIRQRQHPLHRPAIESGLGRHRRPDSRLQLFHHRRRSRHRAVGPADRDRRGLVWLDPGTRAIEAAARPGLLRHRLHRRHDLLCDLVHQVWRLSAIQRTRIDPLSCDRSITF
jgi:hypothetical protein